MRRYEKIGCDIDGYTAAGGLQQENGVFLV